MKVNADPTKEFFMTMLTRDISLTSAILDLVDNCIDAAKSNGGCRGKKINLEVNESTFKMEDTCGGMSKHVAEHYAFKFGRDIDAPMTPNAIGKFGVGMKRAFFKIGNIIEIDSLCGEDSFSIIIDAEEWKKTAGWEFYLEDNTPNLTENGVRINIENLHETVSIEFSDMVYVITLSEFIADAHHKAISEGIEINVNGQRVVCRDLEIKKSAQLGILGKEYEIKGVKVKVISGIGERILKAGGWNIFCNNRLIEGANKTKVTGWGTQGMRAYHTDLAYFRGMVEFNSEDGALLPWNTTKNGVDIDNPIYKSVLVEMVRQTKIIDKFLKDRTKEQTAFETGVIDSTPINDSIESADKVSFFDADFNETFVRETSPTIPRSDIKRISYVVTNEQLSVAKDTLTVTTAADVGRLTFEYFMENEV
ncbi:ATP-binding protein [Colwellia sp. TT2012]|uniref:ATP-binding protein n=1 Tax=Colwellia sp. TT2012 TaxID=1720342 RepID=UPI00070B4E6E|nr:ATP-binding protein [Colwellia sp. TT2012]